MNMTGNLPIAMVIDLVLPEKDSTLSAASYGLLSLISASPKVRKLATKSCARGAGDASCSNVFQVSYKPIVSV